VRRQVAEHPHAARGGSPSPCCRGCRRGPHVQPGCAAATRGRLPCWPVRR